MASWYGIPYDGRRAASGEIFHMEALTAAHKKLPFQTWVEVTNLRNGKQVSVRINDRGPFVRGRIIDLSLAAAREIDMVRSGTDKVRLKVIPPPPAPPTMEQEAPPAEPRPVEPPPVETVAKAKLPEGPIRATLTSQRLPAEGPAPSGEFAVQVGVFSDHRRAEALSATLTPLELRIVETESRQRKLWRVIAGSHMNKDAAEALASGIRKSGGEALVVRESALVSNK